MKKDKGKKAEGGKRRVFSDGLSKATQRSYDTKDSFGGGVSYLKKDKKVPLWNCNDGEQRPYRFACSAGGDGCTPQGVWVRLDKTFTALNHHLRGLRGDVEMTYTLKWRS